MPGVPWVILGVPGVTPEVDPAGVVVVVVPGVVVIVPGVVVVDGVAVFGVV